MPKKRTERLFSSFGTPIILELIFTAAEIWGYNLTTETEFQVTNLPGRIKQTPRIWEDKVFVHMSIASGGDGIFVFDLPDGAK